MEVEKMRKRKASKRASGSKTKQFQPPRKRQSVIPGLLRTAGEEKKVLYSSGSTSGGVPLSLNSTGSICALNLIQVGSSMFNRIGRRIEMISIRFSALYNPLSVTRVVPTDYGRIMIVYDRQTNGAYPALADILQDTDQTGANTTSSKSGLNMNNRERFVTIMDKRLHLPQVTITGGAITAMFPSDTFEFRVLSDEYRKLPKLTTHFKADSNPAVIGDISTGALYILSLSREAAGSEAFEIYDWNCRLKYIDV